MPEIGALLGGKYRVEAQLGEGGMGTVYRAENMLTGKRVALKCMHPHVAAHPAAAERFLREARASSRLSHPNIVDVYDVVQDGTALFMVMELLQGETLRAYLTRNARPQIPELIALLLPAMDGVAAAHDHGVIHRDLKPDNIFLVRGAGSVRPTTKVVDFGIAKLASSDGSTLTETGTSIGTPVYMSFEQLRGDKDVDGRADVYAFGVMLYQALTGHPPFAGLTLSELAIRVATSNAAPVHTARPDVPRALAEIVDRAIMRDRAQRWPTVHSLRAALVPFAAGRGPRSPLADPAAPPLDPASRATPTESSLVESPMAATAPLPASDTTGSRARPFAPDTLSARELQSRIHARSAWPIWAASCALLIIAGVVAVLILSTPSAPRASAGAVEAPREASPPAPPPPPPPPAEPVHLEVVDPRGAEEWTGRPSEAAQPMPLPEAPLSPAAPRPLPSTTSRRPRPHLTSDPAKERAARPERSRPSSEKSASDLLGF